MRWIPVLKIQLWSRPNVQCKSRKFSSEFLLQDRRNRLVTLKGLHQALICSCCHTVHSLRIQGVKNFISVCCQMVLRSFVKKILLCDPYLSGYSQVCMTKQTYVCWVVIKSLFELTGGKFRHLQAWSERLHSFSWFFINHRQPDISNSLSCHKNRELEKQSGLQL